MDSGWITRFPDLAALPTEDRRLLTDHAHALALPAGVTVFAPGKAAENFLLVQDGIVRVQQVSAAGREIVLYRVGSGESCIMTSACLLAEEAYSAEGITETPVSAIAIPKASFETAIARSPGFRRVIFSDYSNRISDLMHVVEEVAFERLDKRLAHRLLARADANGTVMGTHQDLAADLGTAREVISRTLKELQRRNLVSVTRGRIDLLNRPALQTLAEG